MTGDEQERDQEARDDAEMDGRQERADIYREEVARHERQFSTRHVSSSFLRRLTPTDRRT